MYSTRFFASWNVALPVLMRKFACFSEISISPIRFPRNPAASINFHAGNSLLTERKQEPAVFTCGCVSILFLRSLSTSGFTSSFDLVGIRRTQDQMIGEFMVLNLLVR